MCLIALALMAQAVVAVEPVDLFHETLEVASQGQQDRQRGARKALARVLVRVSGTRDVLQNSEVRSALGQADRYLEQFSYRRVEGEDGDGQAYELVMDFQPQATTDILRRANQPVWAASRPGILAWIELNDGNSRQVVTSLSSASGENMTQWATLISDEARRRGLPVALPSRTQVLAMGGSDGGLSEVARQQGAALVLVGDLRVVNASCAAEWSMQLDGRGYQWKYSTDNGRKCVGDAMDTLAETLSTKYAFASEAGHAEPVMVQVGGLASFEDYTGVLLMLEALAVVDSATVHSAAADRVRFSLVIKGGVDQLKQAIRLGNRLEETATQASTVLPPAFPEQPGAGQPGGLPPGTVGSSAPAVGGIVPEQPESGAILYYRLLVREPRFSALDAGGATG